MLALPNVHPALVLVPILTLMARDPDYRRWNAHEIVRQIVPAVMAGQVRLWVEEGEVKGFVCWAMMSREHAVAYLGGAQPVPEMFTSGDQPVVTDMIGRGRAIRMGKAVRRLLARTTTAQRAHWTRRREGRVVRIGEACRALSA